MLSRFNKPDQVQRVNLHSRCEDFTATKPSLKNSLSARIFESNSYKLDIVIAGLIERCRIRPRQEHDKQSKYTEQDV
jgi:hypothetical protein